MADYAGSTPVDRNDLEKAIRDARVDVCTGATATGASLTLAALGAGPTTTALVGASAAALKLSQRLAARSYQKRQDRSARALDSAAQLLDVGLDILEEKAASHDARLELLARVLEAAARASLDRKVQALAAALAQGLVDDGSVHEALVLADALSEVEAGHMLVLNLLNSTPSPPEGANSPKPEDRPEGWTASQVASAMPWVAEIVDALFAVLAGRGLIRSQAGGSWIGIRGAGHYAISPLGQRCLFLLGIDPPRDDEVSNGA
jgi:hypothetical protein